MHGNLPPGDDPDRRRLRCVGSRQVRRGTDLKQWRLQLRDDVAKVDADVTLTLRIGSSRRAASVIEYEGTLTYTGKGKGAQIEAISSLDWAIDAQEFGEPYVRTGCAGPFIDVAYPPHSFTIHDAQLLRHPQGYAPLRYGAAEDGSCTTQRMPIMVMGDGRGRHGMFVMQDWAGLWWMNIGWRDNVGQMPSILGAAIGYGHLDIVLEPGDTLPLPHITVGLFHGNLDDGSNVLRRHIRDHVTPPLNGEPVLPPCSFNHWFGFGNDFTAASLKGEVDACADAGLDYFVVDAGWFEGGFREGIGNWELVDATRFPDGIAPFADYVTDRGMKYGTWFEGEFAMADAKLVRDRPEWFLVPPDTLPYFSDHFRPHNRLMNFGLTDVRKWWVEMFKRVYRDWQLRWVRWDFNAPPRPHWEADEPAGRRGWNQIRHVLGLYDVFDQVLTACPDLLIEQCASGGMRMEPGLMRRGHTFWMNDHTTHSDLVRYFQVNGNTLLPANYLNTNMCQSRHDYSDLDYLSHSMGGFGLSGRISAWPASARRKLADAVARFKRIRPLLLEDYDRPTAHMQHARDPVTVGFGHGRRSVVFEFDPPRAKCVEPIARRRK
ncbi:MAG: hypothetical protein CMJ49_05345 [Planctomycetaceae bacterium]|nr:hypothetical protein [Planctomycetaceae bacterium]